MISVISVLAISFLPSFERASEHFSKKFHSGVRPDRAEPKASVAAMVAKAAAAAEQPHFHFFLRLACAGVSLLPAAALVAASPRFKACL